MIHTCNNFLNKKPNVLGKYDYTDYSGGFLVITYFLDYNTFV